MTDWVTVVCIKEERAATAQRLLELAGDARLVRSQRGGTEFLVPADVADRLMTPKRRPRKTEEN